MKLYLLLTAIVVLAFFSNDFGLVDIQKTAVILAAGVDKTEAGYSVTTQIAVPKGSDRSTGGTSSVNITCEGETVSDCIAQVYAETGWVPKLVFCDLVVLGEDAAKEDAIAALDYFLRNEYMPDSCLLAVSEGKAGDLLSSTSAVDDTSSLAVQKLFSDAAEKSGRVVKNTLREFAIAGFGVSKSGYMPFVRMITQQGSDSGQSESQSTAGSSSGSSSGSSGSSGSGSEQKIYTAEETAIFSDGKMVGLLSPEETLAFSLLSGNVFSGTFLAEEQGQPVSLTVLKNSGGVSLNMKAAPTAELTVDLRVRLYDRGVSAPIEDISQSLPSGEILGFATDKITKAVSSLWQTAMKSGCDLFELKTSLYRSSLKKYAEWKDSLLSVITPEPKIKIKALK